MQIDIQTAAAIALPTVGGLAWLFKLQARIDVIDANYKGITDTLAEIKTDVRKIRSFMGGGVER